MARKADRRALGRGLSALLGEGDAAVTSPGGAGGPEIQSNRIPIDRIRANPAQPRRTFNEEDLNELAESLKTHGVIQPVLLRPDPEKPGSYQIVAGERRWRAAQRAGVHELPAIVRELDDKQILELAIIENVQRVDLDPIEEAQGYAQLVEQFGYTQEELATVIGKSRSHLANMMRLLALPDVVREFVQQGKLSIGHARALLKAPAPITLAQKAVAEGLNVRQVETLSRRVPGEMTGKPKAAPPEKDADTRLLESDLSATIKMKVTIQHDATKGGGELRIRYEDVEQLDQLCQKLTS